MKEIGEKILRWDDCPEVEKFLIRNILNKKLTKGEKENLIGNLLSKTGRLN